MIDPKDKTVKFEREGTYYIMVTPKLSFWDAFKSKLSFTYMISYVTEDSYFYLKSSMPLEIKQKPASSNFFRHFVSQFNKDITISLTVFSGNPVLYASFSPE